MKKTLLILIAILLFTSCGTKKKQLEKTRLEIEAKYKLDSIAFSKVTSEKKKVEEITADETEKEESIEYNGKKGDSLKVIKIGENGKILSGTIYTGTGKAIINNKNKSSNKKTNQKEDLKEVADSKVSVKKEGVKKANTEIKKKEVKTSGFTFITWLWIVGIISVIALGWYLNKRFNLISKLWTR